MKNIEEYIRTLNTHNWKPEKGKTGILFIDLQEYFRGIINPVLRNIVKIADAARERDSRKN